MLEVMLQFEQASWQFSPIIFIGPGLFFALAGLFIWLGGLGLTRALMVALGAAVGVVVNFFLLGGTIVSAVLLGIVSAFIAMIFRRFFISILAAAVIAVIIISYFGPSDFSAFKNKSFNPPVVKSYDRQFGVKISLGQIKIYSGELEKHAKTFASRISVTGWIVTALAVAVMVAVGLYFPNFVSAFCCAVFGAVFIFAGLTLLLLYKGSYPISYVNSRPGLYLVIFGAMVVFGTSEQLLLCRKTKKKDIDKNKRESDESQKSRKLRWLGE